MAANATPSSTGDAGGFVLSQEHENVVERWSDHLKAVVLAGATFGATPLVGLRSNPIPVKLKQKKMF